ncbi:MAG: hypothetical protein IPG56_10260 [Caulobacteraceae bacterium]|nr:hypothetical protein [Caulobacteraceae bacterium]
MLFEYAVEPRHRVGWQNFRYLIEKFGFDRGRLISRFPKDWFREVYAASEALKPIERKRLEEILNQAKKTKVIRSGRPYDQTLGGWLPNAIAQQAQAPFHAIIAQDNPGGHEQVLRVGEVDEENPLMTSPPAWDVERVGAKIADAMRPLLASAGVVAFVDRFFDLSDKKYQDTLRACLAIVSAAGGAQVRCEIHFCEHDSRPPPEFIEREAGKWIAGVLPTDMSLVLYGWKERQGGADFHARYLLTDVGGINIESGFSAEGAHQHVQLVLLPSDLAQSRLQAIRRPSTVYDLVEPVLEIRSDGTVQRI